MGKAPLNLDWNTLLPKHSTDPTPELEIVKQDQQREEQREGVEELSDQQLSERIHRIEKTPKNVLLNLKDRGAKLSASLKRLKEERERRRKLQRRSEVGNLGGKMASFIVLLMTLLRIMGFSLWVLFVLFCDVFDCFFLTTSTFFWGK